MAEPSVDFELDKIEDPNVRQMFYQFRRWYEFREDNGYPAEQSFFGSLENFEDVTLEVPGKIYGIIGMTQRYQTVRQPFGLFWYPMVNDTALARIVYTPVWEDTAGRSIRLYNNGANRPLEYRVTIFYRGQKGD